jgi:hypothetical protein
MSKTPPYIHLMEVGQSQLPQSIRSVTETNNGNGAIHDAFLAAFNG